MLTKFHHYILPVTVPAALWVALSLLSTSGSANAGTWRPHVSFSFFAGFVFLGLVVREAFLDPAHFVNLFIYKYERLFPYESWMNLAMGIFGGVVLAASALLILWRNRTTWLIFGLAARFSPCI